MPLSSLTLIRQYIVTESYAQTLLRKSNRDAGSPLLRNNPAIKTLAVAPPRRNRDQHHRLPLSSNRCGKVVVEMNERHITMLTVCRRMSTKHPKCLKKAVTRRATNVRYHVSHISMNTAQKAPANNSLLRAVINRAPKTGAAASRCILAIVCRQASSAPWCPRAAHAVCVLRVA